MSTPTDPYVEVARLLSEAGRDAARRADVDGAFPSLWGQVELAIQLAETGLPPNDEIDDGPHQSENTTCADLIRRALEVLLAIPHERRRPEHTLDVAYVRAAAADIRRAEAG